MITLYRILICVAVAFPISALYKGWSANGAISYQFDAITAVAFALTALICVGLSQRLNQQPQTPAKSAQPASNHSASGKRQQGEVKWFNGNKGFGFITCDSGGDIFVHFRSVQKNSKRLSPGKRVEFTVVQGKKGEEAEDVVVL